jgi:hypothetical protein
MKRRHLMPVIGEGLVNIFQNTGIFEDLNRYAVNAEIEGQKGSASANSWQVILS